METWIYAVTAVLAAAVMIMAVKIYMLRKGAGEISCALSERLISDTNTLISISTRDKRMRELASTLNRELRSLRDARLRFSQGDAEIRNAMTNISHDLRTPLTAICGYLELTQLTDDPDTVKRYLGVIKSRAEAMTELTEELFRYSLTVSGESELYFEPISVGEVLEESAAEAYAALAERGIVPEIHLPEGKVILDLDRKALSRIFENLFTNAVKYSDGDLEITLDGSGRVTFSNQALGLSEVQVGRLFDRFYTVEAARKSTGLGLSIARTLTEQMGGMIEAKYEEERLSISVTFPDSGK